MITLITGTPGAGKTLYTVAEELKKFGDRPLFIDGIPDLAIPHLTFPEEGLDKWHEWAPDGAVLVVDEAQRSWRPRPSGSKVPEAIAALETHRHKGTDIVLITQHPNLIDQNVRRLVGRHLHIRRVFGWKRAVVYEWDQATDPARVKAAITRSWSYPKSAFKLYRSATVHTARGQRAPWVLWAAIAAAIALPVAIYNAYDRMQNRFFPEGEPSQVLQTPGGAAASASAPPAAPTDGWNPEQFIPRDARYPESAPAFDGLLKVQAAPLVVSCIASKSRCLCYTAQATRVPIPDAECRERIHNPPFNPYLAPPGETLAANTPNPSIPQDVPEEAVEPPALVGLPPGVHVY